MKVNYCEYCTYKHGEDYFNYGTKPVAKFNVECGALSVKCGLYIYADRIQLIAGDDYDNQALNERIKYCPMCGKQLVEEE